MYQKENCLRIEVDLKLQFQESRQNSLIITKANLAQIILQKVNPQQINFVEKVENFRIKIPKSSTPYGMSVNEKHKLVCI